MADERVELLMEKETPMIYSSVALLVMSASAAISPLSNLVHLHPHGASLDTRVNVRLFNDSPAFRDVRIDGQVYTVKQLGSLLVKAPVGTLVYCAGGRANHRRGDVLLQVTSKMDRHTVKID